ncbi:hypothetical protein CFP56_011084 [Quercus suber]|uniref:Uncharacterized protein n=1 Tax=Quercus suber TaxID=58331 RepID=A0AAW0L032_QUESU
MAKNLRKQRLTFSQCPHSSGTEAPANSDFTLFLAGKAILTQSSIKSLHIPINRESHKTSLLLIIARQGNIDKKRLVMGTLSYGGTKLATFRTTKASPGWKSSTCDGQTRESEHANTINYNII